MPKYLGVPVTEDYQNYNGEEKTSYVRVGAEYPHKKECGFNSSSPKACGSADGSSRFPRPRVQAERRALFLHTGDGMAAARAAG